MASKKSSKKKSSGALVNVRIPRSTAQDLLMALEVALSADTSAKGESWNGKNGKNGKNGGKSGGGGKGGKL